MPTSKRVRYPINMNSMKFPSALIGLFVLSASFIATQAAAPDSAAKITFPIISEKACPAAIVSGEPASIIFTGMYNKRTRKRSEQAKLMENPKLYYTPELQKFTRGKIERIACPVLIVHGDQHPINKINHEIIIPEMKAAGKKLEVILYPGQP